MVRSSAAVFAVGRIDVWPSLCTRFRRKPSIHTFSFAPMSRAAICCRSTRSGSWSASMTWPMPASITSKTECSRVSSADALSGSIPGSWTGLTGGGLPSRLTTPADSGCR